MLTLESAPLVTTLPFASSIFTTGCWPKADPAVAEAGCVVKTSCVAVPGVKVTPAVLVIAAAPTLPLIVTACAVVEEVSVRVYVPLALSVAVQSVAHEDGNVPSVVVSLIVFPPAVRLLLFASLAWTVIVVVLEPLAVIEAGLPPIVEVAVEIVPAVMVKVLVGVVRPPPCLAAWMVTEPAMLAVTVSEAMPEEAVALPRPVTDPAPADWVKTTTVELS